VSFFFVKDASIFAGAQVVAVRVLLPRLVAARLLDDRGVAALDQQPPALDVPQDRREDHFVQLRLTQPAAELHERRLIRRGVLLAQAGEAAEADPVLELLLQLRVGEVEPLLQHQAPQHHRRVDRPLARARRVLDVLGVLRQLQHRLDQLAPRHGPVELGEQRRGLGPAQAGDGQVGERRLSGSAFLHRGPPCRWLLVLLSQYYS